MISKDTRHLWILGGVLLAGLLLAGVARALLVPASFGRFGPYRADNLVEQATRPQTLLQRSECVGCHKEIEEVASASVHKSVPCLDCHGVGREHAERCRKAADAGKPDDCKGPNALTADLTVQKEAATCIRCHQKMVGRPTEHKQVVPARHSKKKGSDDPEGVAVCFECHLPHDPAQAPPETETSAAAANTP